MDNYIVKEGQKKRKGPVFKSEVSDALGLTQHYAWHYLVHKNEYLMSHLIAMGYKKRSRTITRSMARFLAKHFDIYIEGVNEEDKELADMTDAIADNRQV